MQHRFPDKTALFRPSDRLLRNPHKGFTSFQRFEGDILNDHWQADRGWMMEHLPKDLFRLERETAYYHPPASVAYFRIPWRVLEPREGEYDFSLIHRILAEAEARDQQVMLRFPPHDARPGDLDLPEWLKEKASLPERQIGDKLTPDHPLYFERYNAFVRAVGTAFDGHGRISAVDVSLVGAWGEGAKIYNVPEAKWRPLVEAHTDSFRKTPLICQHNHPSSVSYANARRPVGFRADCLGNMNIHMIGAYARRFSYLPKDLWEKSPVAFESCWVMGHWFDMGWDLDFIIEQSLKWHISTFNAKSSPVPEEWRDKVEGWIKKMGYRFVLHRVDYPAEAGAGDYLHLGLWIENTGVAPLYHAYPLRIRLRGEGGVFGFETDADVRTWLPGDIIYDPIVPLPADLPAGTYSLEIGLDRRGEIVRFASEGEERDGYLVAGTVTVR